VIVIVVMGRLVDVILVEVSVGVLVVMFRVDTHNPNGQSVDYQANNRNE
jgi:hypothetical protein